MTRCDSEEEMNHGLSLDHAASFFIRCQVDAPLNYSDEDDYISKINAKVFAQVSRRDGSEACPVQIGRVEALRLHGGRAMSDGQSLWDIYDSHTQQTSDIYHLLFRDEHEFTPVIQKMFPDAMSSEVLIIDLVYISPAYRGRELGLRAVRRVIDAFEPDVGIILIKPFPLQFNTSKALNVPRHYDLMTFTSDKATAFRKLRKHWAKLGFRRIPKTAYYAICPANVSPSMRDLDSD